MLRRNSSVSTPRLPRAAEISRTATAAGTSARSKGNTKTVPAAGSAERLHGIGPDVLLDPEILGAAVDPRTVGVGVDRLEADAELADLGQVIRLGALTDAADAADVGHGEVAPVVPDLQPIGEKGERQVGRAGVLSVLDQLEDEVRALAVELAEQFEHGRVPAVAGDVLRPDLVILSGHQ